MMTKDLEVCILISMCARTLLALTYPYVSFRGQTLVNHSFVNLSRVGNDTGGVNSVQCITDLDTCCSSSQGPHRGDWYFPNGTRLPLSGGGDIYEARGDKNVYVSRKNSNTGPSGIYHCDIATNAVHDETNTIRDRLYVGLYLNGVGELH